MGMLDRKARQESVLCAFLYRAQCREQSSTVMLMLEKTPMLWVNVLILLSPFYVVLVDDIQRGRRPRPFQRSQIVPAIGMAASEGELVLDDRK